MVNSGLAVLSKLPVSLAAAWRRSRPGGASPPSWRHRVLFASVFFWIAFSGLGLAALDKTKAPISPAEWHTALTAFVAVGFIPLGSFLLIDTALRLTRRLEAAHAEAKRPA